MFPPSGRRARRRNSTNYTTATKNQADQLELFDSTSSSRDIVDRSTFGFDSFGSRPVCLCLCVLFCGTVVSVFLRLLSSFRQTYCTHEWGSTRNEWWMEDGP
jgi:hypothetical protein